jgi:drug/metabolite transporter (DMT)-like permease
LTPRKSGKWATILIMVLAVVAVTIGDLIMSHAMRSLGPLTIDSLSLWWNGQAEISIVAGEVYELGWKIFAQPLVWMAIGFMLTFLVLWMVALSWSDLTFVMPLTALTYVLNAVLVGPALGEEVSPLRWLGTLLIALGVALVSMDVDDEIAVKP